jgi:type I restriction enzyme S subunit
LILDVDRFVSRGDAVQFRKRCNPENGDILIVSRGATIGRIGLVETDTLFCLMGSVILVKPKKELCNSLFLFYTLSSSRTQENLLLTSQASAQQAIYLVHVTDLVIPMPEIEEQLLIAEFLETETDQINHWIGIIEEEIKLLEEYRTALISEVVMGKIDVREE